MTASLFREQSEIREPHSLCFRPFADLALLTPDPQWLWEGFIARGALAMLAGHPFAGKTTLVSALLKAMESGLPLLDRRTRQATAVVVTEEHDATLRPRMDKLGLNGLRSELVGRGDGVFRVGWASLVAQATEHCLKKGHELLVIDTFSGLAGLQAEGENDAAAITDRLHPLMSATGEGLAVLFLHHLNKNGRARGSSAFSGVVDISIRLTRTKGNRDVLLSTESRFIPPPLTRGRLIETPDGLSSYAASPAGRQDSDDRGMVKSTEERLLEALRAAGHGGLTFDELHSIPGLSVDVAKKRFPDWLGSKIGRHGTGHKGDPYRWRLLEHGPNAVPCAATKEVNGTESL